MSGEEKYTELKSRTNKSSLENIEERRLNRAFQLIRNISSTLDTAIEDKDPSYAILVSMVSPYGLGLSGVLCFVCDEKSNSLRGHMGFTPREKKDFLTLRRNIIRKYRNRVMACALSPFVENLYFEPAQVNLVDMFEGVREKTFSQLSETTKRIRTLSIPFTKCKGTGRKNMVTLACEQRRVLRLRKEEVQNDLPEGLSQLLDKEFVIVPLCHNSHIYYVIFADKRYQNLGFTPIDFLQLEWFRSHTSLLLRNARLIDDLRRAYEEIKNIDTLKTNFLSIISHELRTPLTSIYGFLELLITGKAGELNATQKELLDRINRNTNTLINKVNDLIELAHFEVEGIEHPELTAVDPLSVLMNTLAQLEPRARAKNIITEPVIKTEIPPILANENALTRIFYHLLDNAIKFSPPESKVVAELEHQNNRVMISVIDRGRGIPPEHLQRIFDYFYQLEEPMTRTYEGMGVGLTLTRFLLKATGGEIEVESQLNKGSRFTVIYPVVSK